jgi:cobalt-zinc-cadmium resistance protein CzcA
MVLFSSAEDRDEEVVSGVVLMRPGTDPADVLRLVEKKIQELRQVRGHLLPGVTLEPYWKRSPVGETRIGEDSALWAHAVFPFSASLERVSEATRLAGKILLGFPEVRAVVAQIGGSDDGIAPVSYETVQSTVLLRDVKHWPVQLGSDRQRTRLELMTAMEKELRGKLPGVVVDVSNDSRDHFDTAFVASPGEHVLKIIGRNLEGLQQRAARAEKELARIEGIADVHVGHILGEQHLEFRIDSEKCAKWGVSVADVNNVFAAAIGGQRTTQMIEGERTHDIVVRWTKDLRRSEEAVLDMPVDVVNNAAVPEKGAKVVPAPFAGPIAATPRLRLRDLVSPLGDDGQPDPHGTFLRNTAAVIYREQGKRLISVHFRIRGRDEKATLAEAQKKLAPMFEAPYRAVWSTRP